MNQRNFSSIWHLGVMLLAFLGGASVLSPQPGCLVQPRCFSDADCEAPEICLSSGSCGFACSLDEDCGDGMACEEHRCVPQSEGPLVCPDDMVAVADAFCVDVYEASRPDATETDSGDDSSRATSRAGVMPWRLSYSEGNETAEAACEAAGKKLCTPQQWQLACQGPAQSVYGYGDTYDPKACNGIDQFGLSGFHLLPTGSLPSCRSGWGAYDMNGNLWEHTLGGSGKTVRGGAFNCRDSRALHRCDYVPGTWTPSALGFRCCLIPERHLSPHRDGGTSEGGDS